MDRMSEVMLIISGIQDEIKFHAKRIKKTGDWDIVAYHSLHLKRNVDLLEQYIQEYEAIVRELRKQAQIKKQNAPLN